MLCCGQPDQAKFGARIRVGKVVYCGQSDQAKVGTRIRVGKVLYCDQPDQAKVGLETIGWPRLLWLTCLEYADASVT